MPSPKFATVLARLLAHPELRAAFRRDPAAIAGEFASLDPEALDRQAELLVEKRRHEVSKLLPRTFQALGPSVKSTFAAHASRFWPEGHRRHLADAVAFGRFLRGHPALRRSEWNRVRFELEGGRWALRLVPDARVRGRERAALQVLWRTHGGGVRSAAVWLGLP